LTNERLFGYVAGVSPRASAARQRDLPSTRDVVLDAAERRFADRGFAGVSMREIAAEAGLRNQASLYHHFRDKRALYEAVLGRGVQTIIGMVAESAAGATGGLNPDSVGPVLDRVFDYLDAHPHLPRLIQRAGLDDARYLRSTVTRLLRPLYAQGLRILQGTVGPWDEAELPHLAVGLYHLIFGYFTDATLLDAVAQLDPHSPTAVARQRRFLKTAVAQLLGVPRVRDAKPQRLRRR
jgi:AcrR family transcriptional regulator